MAAAAAIVIALTACSPSPQPAPPAEPPAPSLPSLHSDDPIAVAVDRAAATLTGRELMADAYWLAKRSASLLGGEFIAWKDGLLLQDYSPTLRLGYSREAVETWLKTYDFAHHTAHEFAPPTHLEPIPTPPNMTEAELRQTVLITIKGLECFVECDPERVSELLEDVRNPGGHYLLTHQLFALVIAHDQGCITDAEYAPLRRDLAELVLAELEGDRRFTDLMAERMAMLALAGLPHWIPDWAVETMLQAQRDDGSFRAIPVFGDDGLVSSPPEHTIGLALLAFTHLWMHDHEP